jgi:hypothetical protein
MIFWGLGYNQVESFLTTFDPKKAPIDPEASLRRPSGKRTPFRQDDVNAILERVHRNKGGTYRVIAGRLIGGRILGNWCMDQPDRPQIRQHARQPRDGERPVDRQALPAGSGSTFGMCNDLFEWDLSL